MTAQGADLTTHGQTVNAAERAYADRLAELRADYDVLAARTTNTHIGTIFATPGNPWEQHAIDVSAAGQTLDTTAGWPDSRLE